MEGRLSHDKEFELRMARDVRTQVDEALHMVIGAFLDVEARVLAETAELMKPNGAGFAKTGLALWRLLKVDFDRAAAFHSFCMLKQIRAAAPARHINDAMGKLATLNRAHQEYEKQRRHQTT